MAINMASLRRSGAPKPPIIATYAVHGVGKTSFAAGMPKSVFMQTEDGLGIIEADTFGLLTTFEAVMDAIMSLYNEPHEFQSVVLDSADHLEPLIWAEACRVNKWANVEQPGYGKGYLATVDTWRNVLDGLSALRDERGMAVHIIAHTEVKKYEAPETEAYDRYQPKLHKLASALVQERADAVFFMNYRVSLVKDNDKDKDSRKRAVGGGQRVLYTTERPSHLAKNRFRMPDSISLPDDPAGMWPAVAQHIPFYNQAALPAAAE